MNKYLRPLIILLAIGGFIFFISKSDNKKQLSTAQVATENSIAPTSITPPEPLVVSDADQVVIVHFHSTVQCWSCIELGKLAQTTIEERFQSELASEKVIFQEINGELPENKEVVQLYQARGSSLFINAIKDEQNHIREEVKAWQLITQEEKFKDYLEKEIRDLL